MSKDLINKIIENNKSFSKSHRLISDYLINNYDKAAFMTAYKLGITVGVSEATVVRFANTIGFERYHELQLALQDLVRNKLTSVQRLNITTQQLGNGEILDKVLNLDIQKIQHTLENTSRDDFKNAVSSIINAKTIYIIGARSAAPLAQFLYYYFGLIFENVKFIHTTSSSEIFEQIYRIDKGDAIIGISFPRYSTPTIKAFDFATNQGASVIAITDTKSSPLAQKADYALLAKSDMVSFVDSLVAPLSLINALIVAVARQKEQDISANLSKLEKIWEQYDVYLR